MIAIVLSTAWSQTTPDANGQLFRPSIDARRTLWTDDSERSPNGGATVRGVMHYANRPVVYRNADGDVTPIVGDLLQLSMLAAYARGPLRFGVDAPIYLRSGGLEGGETGLGDVGLDLKFTALDRDAAAIGLALSGRVTLPTTTVDAALGNRGLGYEAQLIADKSFGDLLLAANLGTRGIPGRELENFRWDDQLVARLGVGYGDPERSGVSLDLGTHVNYAGVVPGSTPAEAIAGGWTRPARDIVLRAGLGTGLTTGFGAPRLRGIVGIAWEPARERDADGDGIVDRDDACPTEPEDFDGFQDSDGCPDPTRVIVLVVDRQGASLDATWALDASASRGGAGESVALLDGPYRFTASADGHTDGAAEVVVSGGEEQVVRIALDPLPARLAVAVVDADGAPIPEARWAIRGDRTSHDADTEVEVAEGEVSVRAEAPGYRPRAEKVALVRGELSSVRIQLVPAKVEVTRDRIDIKESVFFETAKAVIKPESFGLLDEVAQTIVDNPQITKIRIEGHTDSRGAASTNLVLSRDRAASVRDYLVGRGVEAARLVSEGFGESRPLDPRENADAWAKNRRVDFFVAERSD